MRIVETEIQSRVYLQKRGEYVQELFGMGTDYLRDHDALVGSKEENMVRRLEISVGATYLYNLGSWIGQRFYIRDSPKRPVSGIKM